MRHFFLAVILIAVLGSSGSAQHHGDHGEETTADWNQWRGPHGDGTSESANPPIQWGPDHHIKWKAPIAGRGSATPIVSGDQIFVLAAIKTERPGQSSANTMPADPGRSTARKTGRGMTGPPPSRYHQFVVASYDRQTGDKRWEKTLADEVPHEAGHSTNSFASASPVTDGKRIFVSFGSRGIFCLDVDGNVIWKRNLGNMQTRASFGEGSSPALHGETLVVPWDHEGQSFLIALDGATGQQKWKVNRDEPTTWATPLIAEFRGRTQVVMNGKRVRSYDLATGDLIWECGGQATNPIACPVRVGDNVVCMTGYRGYAIYAIPLDSLGDVTDSDTIAWHRTDAAPYVASPTLYKGRLYFTKSREGIISSIDAATGAVVIPPTRLPAIGTVYASPVAAEDRIYFTGRDGTTVVIKHADTFQVIATNRLEEGIDASAVILGDELFLRGEKHLYCLKTP
jgi:outer membrane protein assembly factor BamB